MNLKCFGRDIPVIIAEIEDPTLAGYYDPNSHEIVISTSDTSKFDTVIHELFHAVFLRTGLNQAGIPHQVQEVIVENLSIAISENFKELTRIKNKIQKL